MEAHDLIRVDWPVPMGDDPKAGTEINIGIGTPEWDGTYRIIERVETWQFTEHTGTTLWLRKVA